MIRPPGRKHRSAACKRAMVVRRIVQRSVEDHQVELPVRKWKLIELRLHQRKRLWIMTRRAQSIVGIGRKIHRDRVPSQLLQPIRQPAIPRAQIGDVHRVVRQQPRFQILISLRANLPLPRVLLRHILKRQRPVERGIVRPASLRAANRAVVAQEMAGSSRSAPASTRTGSRRDRASAGRTPEHVNRIITEPFITPAALRHSGHSKLQRLHASTS